MPAATEPLSREQVSWRWRILVATYFAYAGYYFTRKVFGLIKTSLNEQFGWSIDSIAHLWTAFLVAYMVGQFLCGFIGRKWGPRMLLLGGLGISIGCNVIFGLTNSYGTFMAFMIFNGLAQASGWPGSVGGVAQWLRPLERGRFMGVWSTSYIVGNIAVKMLGSTLLGLAGWRWSYFGCTLVSFLIWWLVYFRQRNKPEDVGLKPIVAAETEDTRTVRALTADHVTAREYLRLAFNPVILAMGVSYFSIKFLRYALDSWLPTILALMGVSKAAAGWYSIFFDIGGIIPAVLSGWALDRLFKGNWARLCFFMSLGLIGGYLCILRFEHNPLGMAICFGLVGFMIYGPDTMLSGAASVHVAGNKNGVAVAGLVNGIGSLGPVVQEEMIGWILKGQDKVAGIHAVNVLALAMSGAFSLLMLVVMWRVSKAHQQNAEQR